MTIYQVDPDIDQTLQLLSKVTKKSKAWLLKEALNEYVKKHYKEYASSTKPSHLIK